MLISYKSEYPNQVHQLNIAISQHFHVLKNGLIKWQVKKFDVNWNTYQTTNKTHLVTFILRDHFSNCFYAELHNIKNIPEIHEFLFNAWSKKENYEFWGGCKYLIVPQKTLEQFPTLKNFFNNVDKVSLQLPTSGFSTAIRSIRDWENNLKAFTSFYSNCKTLVQVQENIQLINREINTLNTGKTEINLVKWANNQPRILDPGEKERFFNFFKA